MNLEKTTDLFFNFINTCLSVVKILVWTRWPQKRKIFRPDNSPLYLLGNGPSLNQAYEKNKLLLCTSHTLCVNNFVLTNLYTEIKPCICVIAAPEYWIEDVNENYRVNRERVFDAIIGKTNWPMVFCIPYHAKKHKIIKSLFKKNQYVSFYFYNSTPIEGFKWFTFLMFRLGLGMPRPHNVLIPSIMIAIAAGYKRMHLLGADHSWMKEIFVSDDNKVYLSQKHFYDETETKPDTMKMRGKHDRKLFEVLHKFYLTFRNYFIIEDYATKRKVKIYNSTPGSIIDAFEKKYL